jgi:hypothetical protein
MAKPAAGIMNAFFLIFFNKQRNYLTAKKVYIHLTHLYNTSLIKVKFRLPFRGIFLPMAPYMQKQARLQYL